MKCRECPYALVCHAGSVLLAHTCGICPRCSRFFLVSDIQKAAQDSIIHMFKCELRVPTTEECAAWEEKCREDDIKPPDHIGYIRERGPVQKTKEKTSRLVGPTGRPIQREEEQAPVTGIMTLCPFCAYAHDVALGDLTGNEIEGFMAYQKEHIIDLDERERAKDQAKKNK